MAHNGRLLMFAC